MPLIGRRLVYCPGSARCVLTPGRYAVFHLILHALVPLVVARIIFYRRWLTAWGLMMAGMLIDLDHLLADPVYDPQRCGVGFHPLHSALPIGLYALAVAHPRTRLLGLGLLIHIALDCIDCRVTNGIWYARL